MGWEKIGKTTLDCHWKRNGGRDEKLSQT